jgi:hypothetical protein
MKRSNDFRSPKERDGTKNTTHHMSDLLPVVLAKIRYVYHQQAEVILAAWPEIIGDKLAKMTEAVSFTEGILTIKVKNSTLHSLLSRNSKSQILDLLRKRFPQTKIKNIYFRIG